jgi:hypothetical protein
MQEVGWIDADQSAELSGRTAAAAAAKQAKQAAWNAAHPNAGRHNTSAAAAGTSGSSGAQQQQQPQQQQQRSQGRSGVQVLTVAAATVQLRLSYDDCSCFRYCSNFTIVHRSGLHQTCYKNK